MLLARQEGARFFVSRSRVRSLASVGLDRIERAKFATKYSRVFVSVGDVMEGAQEETWLICGWNKDISHHEGQNLLQNVNVSIYPNLFSSGMHEFGV